MKSKKSKIILGIIFLILLILAYFSEIARGIVLTLFMFILVLAFQGGPFLFAFLGFKKEHYDRMDELDFSKDKTYYRDILNEYSPASLSYMDTLKSDFKTEVICTLLMLEQKKKIRIKEEEIEILSKDTADLMETEKCILSTLINRVPLKSIRSRFYRIKIQELKNHDLIKKATLDLSKVGKPFLLAIIIFVISIGLIMLLGENYDFGFYEVILFFFFSISILLLHAYPIYAIAYCVRRVMSFTRSEKGETLNQKLEGLKDYIKDFSSLNELQKEELMIWEDYLIYSVMFHQNKKIKTDLKNIWKQQFIIRDLS